MKKQAHRNETREDHLTLLQKAKLFPSSRINLDITEEQIELAVAWAKGEISYTQVIETLTGKRQGHSTAYAFLARALRGYVQKESRGNPSPHI